jgi:hypothetical protein
MNQVESNSDRNLFNGPQVVFQVVIVALTAA